MFSRGLKPGIIVNLVLLITAAMLLVDLVMFGTLRQELMKSRLVSGTALMVMARPLLADNTGTFSAPSLAEAMKETEASCIMLVNSSSEIVSISGRDCSASSALQSQAHKSLVTGLPGSSLIGKTWGILWPGSKSMVVSSPFKDSGNLLKSVAVELSLRSYYEALRNSQRVFAVYFLINLFALTLLGFHRLYRSLVRPINSLVSTAEEFADNQEFSFTQNTRENEFNILSRSLNKMLNRIKDDRSKLQESIRTLEKTNTELMQAQQEVIRAEKLASVGRLSAGIAHEIGNPVGIVIGYLDLLKQNAISDDQKKDFLARAEKEVNRINTIIRQLLDFARYPQDDVAEITDLNKVISEVAEICSVQPLTSDIVIATELKASSSLVPASAGQLKQIFINLLINGADAIHAAGISDGRIEIITDDATLENGSIQAVTISFRDNGPGVEPEKLQNIFDPFYTTKEPGKGTGLGLSICFTMVENLGGTIFADSGNGGMTITITLPVVNRPPAS
ncbi:MAG: HAMP domain-containing protein [Proteobacteria bacterium]|nr:HAMP domain-containing protein [Pseudomonadota bacterium]MBU1739364.1 HAMP domain-containing protein [Pseudomonadota bacterium]